MAIHSTPSAMPEPATHPAPALANRPAPRRRPWPTTRQPTMAEWAEVRRLHNEGANVDVIARTLGLSRRSVRQVIFPWPRS